MLVRSAPIVEERRVRRQAGDLGQYYLSRRHEGSKTPEKVFEPEQRLGQTPLDLTTEIGSPEDLLVPQRRHRVHIYGATSRDIAGEQGYAYKQ